MKDLSSHAYDKAKWHYGGDYPDGHPDVYAFVHSGFYLTWLVERDLVSDFVKEDFSEEYFKTKNRNVSPIRLYEVADGVLAGDMLNIKGNEYSIKYFENNYFDDFLETFDGDVDVDHAYFVEPTWENYDRLKPILDKRFEKFSRKPFWKR